jgi:hypothetical protein
LQSETDSDSIVLGFAVPKDEPEPFNLVNLNVGIPEIELSALGKFILEPTIKFPELQFIQPGCKITLEVVIANDGKRFIRFYSMPKELRGLKKYRLLTTKVKLEVCNNHWQGLRLEENSEGNWNRSQVTINENLDRITLMDLLDKLEENCFYLPEIYKNDNIIIQVPQDDNQNFTFNFKGNHFRPRAGKSRSKKDKVDFQTDPFCYFPIYKIDNYKDTILLIKSNTKNSRKSLIVQEVSTKALRKYDDLSNYADGSGTCAEFIFD